jgi:DNA-binding protein HU-beta
MNKQQLIDAIAARSSDTKAANAGLVSAVLELVASTLSEGESVQLVGFGTFSVGQRAVLTGRNPATGAEIPIAAAKTVKLTAGKAFKEAVNAP